MCADSKAQHNFHLEPREQRLSISIVSFPKITAYIRACNRNGRDVTSAELQDGLRAKFETFETITSLPSSNIVGLIIAHFRSHIFTIFYTDSDFTGYDPATYLMNMII